MSWIQSQDAEIIKTRFDNELQGEVTLYVFTRDDRLVIPGRPPAPYARETVEIMKELAALSDKLSVKVIDANSDQVTVEQFNIEVVPAIVLVDEAGKDYGIRFYGLPGGFEFAALLDAIINVSRGEAHLLDEAVEERAGALEDPVHLKVFVTPTCPHCPGAVRTASALAIISEQVRTDVVDATQFPELAQRYQVFAVPRVVINDNKYFEGNLPPEQFIGRIEEALEEAV